MDTLASLGGSLAIAIPAFLVILTVVVFFHEMGHFLVARWCGVKVQAFSIGFGPELFGFNDRHGTRWRLALFPLGGFVRFIDDANAASAPDREVGNGAVPEGSFRTMSVWRRAAVVVAGPVANFILAIIIYALLFGIAGRSISAPVVDEIAPQSAAAEAGFQPGDLILSIDGVETPSFNDVQRIVFRSAGLPLRIDVRRDDRVVTLTTTPRSSEITDPFGNQQKVGLLGVSHRPTNVEVVRYNPVEAVGAAGQEVWTVISTTLGYLGGVLTGRESADQIGGPIGIAKVSGQAAELGLIPFINLAAILSVSIGLLNLFPIPLLDGGHLVYYAAEVVRGKPLPERVQDFGYKIGFVLLVSLMIFATKNDVMKNIFTG